MTMNEWTKKPVALNKRKLHMRPLQEMVEVAKSYRSEVRIVKDMFVTDAKSILEMIELAGYMTTTKGNNKLTLQAMGNDSRQAVEALAALVKEINKSTAEKPAVQPATDGQKITAEAEL